MKKQITPEQAVARLKVICVLVICAITLMFIARLRMKKHPVETKSRIEMRMDSQLDSIIKVDYPDGTKVISTGIIERINVDEVRHRRERVIINRYEIARKNVDVDPEQLEQLKKEAREAQEKMDQDMKEDRHAYFRNVIFELPDSTQKSAYQRTEEALDSSYFVTIVTVNKNNNFKIHENNNILQ